MVVGWILMATLAIIFEFLPEHTMFILQGYAAFNAPKEVLKAFMDEYSEQLAEDIDEHGSKKIENKVRQKVYSLNPERADFPERYKEPFEELRADWIESAKGIRGFHRTGRLEELQALLDRTLAYPLGEDFGYKDQAQLVLKIISEMRQEGDKAQIHIKDDATQQDIHDEITDYMKEFTPEQLKELEDARANDKPVAPIIDRFIRDIKFGERPTRAALADSTESGEPA